MYVFHPSVGTSFRAIFYIIHYSPPSGTAQCDLRHVVHAYVHSRCVFCWADLGHCGGRLVCVRGVVIHRIDVSRCIAMHYIYHQMLIAMYSVSTIVSDV